MAKPGDAPPFASDPRTRYVQTMADFSFSLPTSLQTWVEQRMAEGRYADAAEYLRDLIRRDQEAGADDAAWVRAMVVEGFASGFVEGEPAELIEGIIAEISASDG